MPNVEQKQQMILLARQVAQLLSTPTDVWTVPLDREHEEDYYNVLLHGPAHQVVSLACRDGRLQIHGEYPTALDGTRFDTDHHLKRPTITLAFTSTPAAVADNLRRRFLPDYRHTLTRVLQLVESHDRSEFHKHQNLVTLAAAVGLPPPADGRERFTWAPHRSPLGSVEVTSVSEHTTYLEIRGLEVPLAVRILEMLHAEVQRPKGRP